MPTLAWACSSTAMDHQIVADTWRQRLAIQGDRVILSSYPGPIARTLPPQTCPRKRGHGTRLASCASCFTTERYASPGRRQAILYCRNAGSAAPVHALVMSRIWVLESA